MNRSRTALAAAAYRIRKDRKDKERKTTEEVDAERSAKGKTTRQEERGGLPAVANARRLATHLDEHQNAWVATDDPRVFGVKNKRAKPFPSVGDVVLLTLIKDKTTRTGRVMEVQQLSSFYNVVAIL